MLVPGFTVEEVPVRLRNINNLRFAPDGRLTALGYDGTIWLLRDTDGDGLEDAAEPFWDRPTLRVPVGMAWSTHGLYVSSHGKVSLLRDTDGDGRADAEEVIARGWPPTDVASGGVDATAVTLDPAGNVYFGLLVADYSNAYRLRPRKDLTPAEREWLARKAPAAHPSSASPSDAEEWVCLYDLDSPRGTIQKWDPRTGRRQTVATGIRVPFALAFNRAGDLFNTDQEGETWMPHGNPLDELNHILPGRNYGFPPPHPKWLPGLVSEPPVVAFGPQHQSACGLVFNEPHGPVNLAVWRQSRGERIDAKADAPDGFNDLTIQRFNVVPLPVSPGQGLFGPQAWEGDAFVAGESRGKIWRVRLVKTATGYLGQAFTIARLGMLTTDLAISPRGDLYVSCHSGPPDWGTGPQGEGKLFRIRYAEPGAPQPVMAWAAAPDEVRVAFDRPLSESILDSLSAARIEGGQHVDAGDRFEVLKPPYEAVREQEARPRQRLRILGGRLTDQQRTLVLATEPHPPAAAYALELPGVRDRPGQPPATVELRYTWNGWQTRGPSQESGWLPHSDPAVTTALLGQAARPWRRWLVRPQPFQPELRTRLRLPKEAVALRLTGSGRLRAVLVFPDGTRIQRRQAGSRPLEFWLPSSAESCELRLRPEAGQKVLRLDYTTGPAAPWRPVPLTSFFVPWAVAETHGSVPAERALSTSGGDYERGRALFYGESLKCATCHRLRGEGATVGPDLSNLVSRDAASVLRDLKEPSAAIHPDYVAYQVRLRDGEELTGFLRAQEADVLRFVTADAREHEVARSAILEMRPSGVSLMPEGLLDALAEEQVRDLLTFLLHAPPQRESAEVAAILSTATNPLSALRPAPLKLVLVASPQDHGPGQHDYPAWQKTWHAWLAQAPGVTVSDAREWPSMQQWATADAILFYCWNHDWSAPRLRQLDDFLARGGGVLVFHSATIADTEPERLAQRLGLAAQPGRTAYRHTPFDLKLVAPAEHPITRGLPAQLRFLDEPYWPLIGDTNRIDVLAMAEIDGAARPLVWTFQTGTGRVVASILGHYTWTLNDPLFRLLALRGLAWVVNEPADRFERLLPTPAPGSQE